MRMIGDCSFLISQPSATFLFQLPFLFPFLVPTVNRQDHLTMTFKDRTNEFHSVVDRMRNRSQQTSSTLERRALLSSPSPKSSAANVQHHPRSEFSLMASEISRNITSTASKLEKLTKRKKTSCQQTMYFCLH